MADSPFAQAAQALPDYRYRIEFWAVLGCFVLFTLLFELVRRRKLKERYSFLWFLTGLVLVVFVIRRDWLEDLARLVGIYYPPTALLIIVVFFLLLILIHYSTVITRLMSDNQTLVQEVGLLESRVRELERAGEAKPGTAE